MSSSNSISVRKISSNSKNCQQYFVSTNEQNSTGRVIIAKAHPPNENCHNSNNNLAGPIQFEFNSRDGTLYSGNNSFFQSQSNNGSNDVYFPCNGSYLVPSLENSSQPLTHTTRASPATVQWLVENFEPAEGCSLRRSTLYSFYIQHCSEQKLEAVNPASFGKLIRSVFLGLRTRRLGTRGNSKYHYYGIRLKQNSNLNIYSDEHGGLHFKQNNSFQHFKNHRWSNSNEDLSSPENKPIVNYPSPNQNNSSINENKQFNSLFINSNLIIDTNIQLPININMEQIKHFENSYKDHCQKLFDVITTLDFDSVEQIWLNYWSDRELNTISSLNCVENFIMNCDYQFYDQVVQRLITDILSPMPVNVTQSIRTFGKSVDGWLRQSLNNYSVRFKTIKLTIVNAFAMTLRRYTSLNHLAQAARSVLLNSTQVNQMLADLNKVDFHNIQEQAWWICECDENIVLKIEKEFKEHLSLGSTLEEWCHWLNSLLNDLIKPYSSFDGDKYIKQMKQILLNWSFYSSMIIRDLTLRSASSFGSFHLIRLLYDEYLFYLSEHKIALHTQRTPIAVIAQSILENKLLISDGAGERRNIQSKISLVVKKDNLSQAKILTLPHGTVQLPIFNKLVSAAKLAHEQRSEENDSVKRLKTNDEIINV